MADLASFQGLFDVVSSLDQMESLIDSLPTWGVKSQGYNAMAMLNRLLAIGNDLKKSRTDFMTDMTNIVVIALKRGNSRDDQIEKTSEKGRKKILELCKSYQIATRKNKRDRIALTPTTFTFPSALSLFPQIASLMIKSNETLITRVSEEGQFGAHRRPNALEHTGAAVMFPFTDVGNIFLLAHTAYMIEFSRIINPSSKYTDVKVLYKQQIHFNKAAQEGSYLTDAEKVGLLKGLEITTLEVFEAICVIAIALQQAVEEKSPLKKDECIKIYVVNKTIIFIDEETDESIEAGEGSRLLQPLHQVESHLLQVQTLVELKGFVVLLKRFW